MCVGGGGGRGGGVEETYSGTWPTYLDRLTLKTVS